MTQQPQTTTPASQRWVEIRSAAGFTSDRALERTAGMTAGTIWTWTTPGKGGRDPNVRSLRVLKQLLGVSLDELDAILTGWREELTRADQAKHSG